MRRLLAALLLVSGCDGAGAPASADAQPAPDAAATADAGDPNCTTFGSDAFRIVSLSPTVLPVHGALVTLTYEGATLQGPDVYVNGHGVTVSSEAPYPSPFSFGAPAAAAAGPFRLSVTNGSTEIAWIDCAGEYVVTPAQPTLVASAGLPVAPLHPELDRPCARSAYGSFHNDGDALLVVTQFPTLTGSPGFSILDEDCTGIAFGYQEYCSLQMCFSSTTPMVHTTRLDFTTDVGAVDAEVAITVLPAATGLDPSFGGDGVVALVPAVFQSPVVGGAALRPDGTLMVWRFFNELYDLAADGTATLAALGAVQAFSVRDIRALRRAAPGQGFYLMAGASDARAVLLHFADDGTRDLGFAGGAGEVEPNGNGDFFGFTAVEVQPSGRVVVMGHNTASGYTATGAIDPTFGVAGVAPFFQTGSFRGPSAMDTQGRIYLGVTTGVLRLLVDGGVDPSFAYGGAAQALAMGPGDQVLVAAAGGVVILGETGAPTALPLAPVPELAGAMADLDLDAQGRLYLTTAAGQVLRFAADGSFDGVLGFEGAASVVCPAAGGCWIAGATPVEGYVLRLAP